MKKIYILLFFCCHFSCEKKPNVEVSNLLTPKTELDPIFLYLLDVEEKLPNWTVHWKGIMEEFDINKFTLHYQGQLPEETYEVTEANLPEAYFEDKLLYKSDSTCFLDLYSYKIEITKSKGKLRAGLNPDSEAAIYDLMENNKKRLLFIGPVGGIEDGFWINNQEIILTGFGEIDQGISPYIWYINLETNSILTFEYPLKVKYDPNSYLKLIMPELNF
jgi:hypothetical protein